MEFPIIDNTAEYVEFMKKNFPQKKIGKMPKSDRGAKSSGWNRESFIDP